jgi:flagellar hook protein FlgE
MTFAQVFAIGVSGVTAFAKGLEAISANIANTGTVGYKRARTDFGDLVAAGAVEQKPGRVGGVAAANRPMAAEQGAVTRTSAPTNVAIAGAGFFVVSREEAGAPPFLFTRSGDFSATSAGFLKNAAGHYLQGYAADVTGAAAVSGLAGLQTVNILRTPPIAADAPSPGELTGVEIDAQGLVFGRYATGERIALYQIPLALFASVERLDEADGTTFMTATAAGPLSLSAPQDGRAGTIEGSALELSTTDIGREFSTLIETQRAYASNARVISVADELWRKLAETAA